jgi:hypothetical protein
VSLATSASYQQREQRLSIAEEVGMSGYDDYYDRIDEMRRDEVRLESIRTDDRRHDEIVDESRRELYEDWDRRDAERRQQEQTTRFFGALREGDSARAADALGLGLESRAAREARSAVPAAVDDLTTIMQRWLDLSDRYVDALSDGDLESAERIDADRTSVMDRFTAFEEERRAAIRPLWERG